MKGEWCYYKQAFTPEECDLILKLGLQLPQDDAKLGVGGDVSNNSFRRSKIRFIQKEHPQFGWLHDGHQQFNGACCVHLLPNDRFNFSNHPQTHRHIVINSTS